MNDAVETVREFCVRVLGTGDLATKLAAPRTARGERLADRDPGPPLFIRRPVRTPGLALAGGADKLPALRALRDPRARARCLARFAHHELMAVELFAWALLRWPELAPGLRRHFVRILEDEQRHCGLYLARLAEHGERLEDHSCSDYFWRQSDAIAASGAGPRAFVAAMGLTLEQANLDFTLRYRDAFCAAGDSASAAVIEQVHGDEIRHVSLAARALAQLDGAEADEVARYRRAVPFPLSAARAKGRPFRPEPRRRAGLGEGFIEFVRRARSSQERAAAHSTDPRAP